MTAYTAIYEQGPGDGAPLDEREAARRASAPYPQAELREVPARVEDLLAVLRRIVWHMDGPGFSPAVFPLWRIMEGIHAEGVKVVLEGQGADELLGGYAWHLAAAVVDDAEAAWRQHSLRRLGDAGRALGSVPGAFPARAVAGNIAAELFAPARRFEERRRTLGQVLAPELAAEIRPLDRRATAGGGRLRERLLADFTSELLPSLLHYGDTISMAHSIEVRLPFLDHRLVELCFALPDRYKVDGGSTKAILRTYLRSGGRTEVAAARRKRGFPTPSAQWLADDDGAVLREVLLDRGAASAPYVRRDALERAIARHADGHYAAGDMLFALLSTELWLQECVQVGAA
jgi:asparagine synthase (glutamine-hydrolysing)